MFKQRFSLSKHNSALLLCLALFSPPSISAEVTITGSSTLESFLKQWASIVQAKSPTTQINISSPGTSVAPKALVQDRTDLAAMNREMTNDESEAFIRTHGYYPTAIAVAIEAVALYVHPSNPLPGLDIVQLDAIYSKNHGCGWRETIDTWGKLGVDSTWKSKPINLLSHDKKSAVRDFFNKTVICRDDFKEGIPELKHTELLAKIAEDPYALGYGNYQPDSKLKMVPIKKGGSSFVPLTLENVYNRSYRLQHYLYLYVNKPKDKAINPAVLEFLKTGLSQQGQSFVKDAGYIPLSDELIQRQLNKLTK